MKWFSFDEEVMSLKIGKDEYQESLSWFYHFEERLLSLLLPKNVLENTLTPAEGVRSARYLIKIHSSA